MMTGGGLFQIYKFKLLNSGVLTLKVAIADFDQVNVICEDSSYI